MRFSFMEFTEQLLLCHGVLETDVRGDMFGVTVVPAYEISHDERDVHIFFCLELVLPQDVGHVL